MVSQTSRAAATIADAPLQPGIAPSPEPHPSLPCADRAEGYSCFREVRPGFCPRAFGTASFP